MSKSLDNSNLTAPSRPTPSNHAKVAKESNDVVSDTVVLDADLDLEEMEDLAALAALELDADDEESDQLLADDELLEDEAATEGGVTFESFNLPPLLAQTLKDMGYTKPTPVQAQAIPLAMEGRDILATAQTGTGKTAAFALPLLNAMLTGKRAPALILAPTRELAEQTAKVLQQLTQRTPQLKTVLIIGGSSYNYQIRGLKSKPAFVVGTPGRLIDQMSLGNLRLGNFGALVLDEADRMLDMGFAPQLEQLITQMPEDRHTMLFSATLPNEIKALAARYLRNPERIAIGDSTTPVDRIKQEVIEVDNKHKGDRLLNEIDKVEGSLIIFTRTKTRVEQVTKLLTQAGHRVARIHGDRSQRQRGDAIREFREGFARILVATDIAARGIDIPHIKYVVNFDLPLCPEDYIHRIGRTARAGAEGNAWAFVTPEETFLWARIFKMMYGKYPEGFDRRRGGNRTANQRPNQFGGRRGGGFGGGDRFGRGGGGGRSERSFGAGRFDSGSRPSPGGRWSPGQGGERLEGPAVRPNVARREERSNPVSAPAVLAAPSAPSMVSTPTAPASPRPAAKPREASNFEKTVKSSFAKREREVETPSATFAADILASATTDNATSEAPAGMNRAARRAMKFTETHREDKAREGNRNEDSVIRESSRARKSDAVSRTPVRAPAGERRAFGGERREGGGFGGGERRAGPGFGGPRREGGGFGGGERRGGPGFGGPRREGGGFGGGERRGGPSFGGPRREGGGFGGGPRREGGGFGGGERRGGPSFGGPRREGGFTGQRPSFGGQGGERRSFSKPEGRPFAPRGESSSRPGQRFDRPSRPEGSGQERSQSRAADRGGERGERPPSKRSRFTERLSEMLGN